MKNESNDLSKDFECRCSIKSLNTLLINTPPPNPYDMGPSKHQKIYDIIMHEVFTNQCDPQKYPELNAFSKSMRGSLGTESTNKIREGIIDEKTENQIYGHLVFNWLSLQDISWKYLTFGEKFHYYTIYKFNTFITKFLSVINSNYNPPHNNLF